MGVVDLQVVEVTLLLNGKKKVKRLNGDFQEALMFSKLCRVTLSDGTEYFTELRLVPGDFMPGADSLGTDYFFIEGYGVFDDGAGKVVHEKRGYV